MTSSKMQGQYLRDMDRAKVALEREVTVCRLFIAGAIVSTLLALSGIGFLFLTGTPQWLHTLWLLIGTAALTTAAEVHRLEYVVLARRKFHLTEDQYYLSMEV